VREDVDRMLRRCGGVASRELLFRQGLDRHRLDNEVRSGALVAVFPRAYCRPWDVDEVEIRERGALMSVGHPVSLSHLSALRRWGVLARADESVHVTVPARRLPRGADGLVVHRVNRFPPVVKHSKLITVTAPTAITTSWPLLRGPDERAPAVTAVRSRLATPAALRRSIAEQPRLAGRADLQELVELLDSGCESELEFWGHLRVFDVEGLRHAVRQRDIIANGHRYRLDLAYEVERVAIELDGFAFHSTKAQRERDMIRDAALAACGWLTLRYSHQRLHADVAGCRRDTLAALAARRR
jgi:very-short-patch-repair endonuclease